MTTTDRPRPDRQQTVLIVAMIACYAVGYPVAIVAHSAVGWALVMLGGVLLFLLLLVTVRRINRGPDEVSRR